MRRLTLITTFLFYRQHRSFTSTPLNETISSRRDNPALKRSPRQPPCPRYPF
ncbi:hypothetical protein KCP71_16725 [Salmonella enterica subsp. enterica]|nr:hypothetical protein KCP71_16725 [Salmonella enterica subsp. enterica]